ncbi:MAG: type VI secretion system tip protein VgrG [Chitinophagaceae bacterium]|nr:type VI secretion system tip protein VgrG [Rubrivivax sp.]
MPDTRLLLIKTPLGEGALIATRLSVTETLGLPYSIEVEVMGSNHGLQASDLLTKPITVTVSRTFDGREVQRHFHGLIAEFERLGPGIAGRTAYRLVAVPGLWRLGLKRNCRIFQDKTVKDIVTTVLAEHEQAAPSWGILPALEPIPYCTQFNETELHFVSRLLEEHGMACYFSHTASAHKLHISATAPGFPAFEGGDVKAVHAATDPARLAGWHRASRARSAAVAFADMDGQRSQPSVVLSQKSPTRRYANEPEMWSAGEVARWPGGMSTRPGLQSAAVAMGEQETESETFTATIGDPRFIPGARLSVAVVAEDKSESSDKYVVTSVQHQANDHSGLDAGAGGREDYHGSITLVNATRSWMPTARHPRPVMAGLYSAKVTGPAGEKIHVDEFGRIKVKFRWDRLAKDDDTSSCWVRVAQAAAGGWGGTWFLPRVGDEVLVAFLDGDPDRPIVTGSVYGKDDKPPFDPKANRAQSGISTRSYKSDSKDDANILRFEDKKSSEHVFLHAQKDLLVEVENDETRTIDHDQTETIKNARTVTVKDSHDTLTLEKGNRVEAIKMGNDTLDIKQGNRATTLDNGNDSLTLKMGNEAHSIKMGNMTVKCDLGSVTIEAMQKITLKVGGNSVVIDQMGVTVKGIMITEEAMAMHKTKAAMVQVDADGMVMVKGGVVMLN